MNDQQTIGIVGGGQLGRMLAMAAKRMGFTVGVLDPIPDGPTAQVCDWQLTAAYDDEQALTELASRCDVITYELEQLNSQALLPFEFKIPQGLKMLEIAQDRLVEKTFLKELNLKTAAFVQVDSFDDLEKALHQVGFPAVLKKRQGGYDGKSQWKLEDWEDVKQLPKEAITESIVEEWLSFDKELSILVGRNSLEDVVVFPIAHNIHENHILRTTVVPAQNLSRSLIDYIELSARKIAEKLEVQGILAIELFLTTDNQIYINELAPRPHNSGHYTIEGCELSQFEAHIRGICDWSLPEKSRLLAPICMENILGQDYAAYRKKAQEDANIHFHDYGKKEKKRNRKVGHITYFLKN